MATHGAGHFIAQKAGMSTNAADKERIQKLVEESSKGSKYYANALARDEALQARVDQLKEAVARTPATKLHAFEEAMNAFASRVEAHRSLCQVHCCVDMDQFFAAVEALDNPALVGKPFAVGGLGMLSTASYEARKYGVRSAMPGFIARKLCPQLILVPPHFEKYTAASKKAQAVFRQYDPHFGAMSLDEALLDLTQACCDAGVFGGAATSAAGYNGAAEGNAEGSTAQRAPESCAQVGAAGGGAGGSSGADEEARIDGVKPEFLAAAHSNSSGAAANGCGGEPPKSDADLAPAAAVSSSSGTAAEPGSSARRPPGKRVRPAGMRSYIPTPSQQEAIAQLVARVRAAVTEATGGLTCSAGIAANPMLAKIVSNERKPDGQMLLPFDRPSILAYLHGQPVRKIPGVGKVTERMLTELGLHTCGDLLARKGVLRAAFNERMAQWLVRCALGISEGECGEGGSGGDSDDEGGVGRKSISQERTFADCGDAAVLAAKCRELADKVAAQMVSEQVRGRTVTVKVKLHTFEVRQRSVTLPRATNDAAIVRAQAETLLAGCMPAKLRLLGVRVSTLSKEGARPATMLDTFFKAAAGGAGGSDPGASCGAGEASGAGGSTASTAGAPGHAGSSWHPHSSKRPRTDLAAFFSTPGVAGPSAHTPATSAAIVGRSGRSEGTSRQDEDDSDVIVIHDCGAHDNGKEEEEEEEDVLAEGGLFHDEVMVILDSQVEPEGACEGEIVSARCLRAGGSATLSHAAAVGAEGAMGGSHAASGALGDSGLLAASGDGLLPGRLPHSLKCGDSGALQESSVLRGGKGAASSKPRAGTGAIDGCDTSSSTLHAAAKIPPRPAASAFSLLLAPAAAGVASIGKAGLHLGSLAKGGLVAAGELTVLCPLCAIRLPNDSARVNEHVDKCLMDRTRR
jgi:nucleotidyltransferase/DNA polymerase involved in DNA repair